VKVKRNETENLRGDRFGKRPSFHGGLVLHVLDLLFEHILIHLGEYGEIQLAIEYAGSLPPPYTSQKENKKGTTPTSS
jgi:hypothetical protein